MLVGGRRPFSQTPAIRTQGAKVSQDESELGPPSRSSQLFVWLLLAGLCGLTLLWLLFAPTHDDHNGVRHPSVGRQLPHLQLQPLTGDSESLELADLRGRVVLLNFWGTWCPPCRLEFPHIEELGKRFKRNPKFRLLAVSCGTGPDRELEELRAATSAFLEQSRSTLPTYADQYAYTRRGLAMTTGESQLAYPSTIILDPQGIIRGLWEGYNPESIVEMRELVEKLAAE